ncbi:MAG TPA: transcriptional repressor [Coxiellaceae bacterium]|nr:transcriptional repressor [Coxiellaceae bacterium]
MDKKLCKKLNEINEYCVTNNIRLTPLRAQILELIYQSEAAIGAYDLLRLLRKTKANAEAMTVYRVLEFLQEHHLVHRVESLNAYIPCSHHTEHHHSQLLLCKQCGESSEIADHNLIQAIRDCLQTQGFSLGHGITEIRGLCYNCAE